MTNTANKTLLKQTTTLLTASSLVIASALSAGCSSGTSAGNSDVDLVKVLNVFETSLNSFTASDTSAQNTQSKTDSAEAPKEASDSTMKELTNHIQTNLNNPSFTPTPVGLELKQDGMFEGYADKNGNATRDSGEDKTFTVEVDTETSRLIATDVKGESTGMNFSMTGFLAGMLLGNLLSRQKRSGGGSFKDRKVKSTSQYNQAKAGATSSTSGSTGSSAKSKSFSGSHTSGK